VTSLVSNTFEGLGFIDRHMQNFVTQESSSLKILFKISQIQMEQCGIPLVSNILKGV